MKSKRLLKAAMWVIGLALVATAIIRLTDVYERPQRVASMLNISSLPQSLQIIECKSDLVLTDVVATCSIQIAPNDFPNLLRGYQFTESPTTGTSHSVVFTKVGPEFQVTTEYTAEPKEFRHGGHVKIFTDQDKKHAVIDLYIE